MNARPANLFEPRSMPGSRATGILAVEIGGTTMRIARFDLHANPESAIVRVPVPNYLSHADRSADEILTALFDRLRRAASDLFENDAPAVISVAYPGPVTASGVALRSPTIFGPCLDQKADIASYVRLLWPSSNVHVLNDLTCAGHYFVGRGARDFCVVTVGSGIGNKIFLDGLPQIGAGGFGGEIGHLRTSPQPGTPVAGIQRELGEISSGRGSVWLARRWPGAMQAQPVGAADRDPPDDAAALQCESEALSAAFRAGDPRAQQIIRAAAYPLALAMSSLHLGLGVTQYFIVGGFAKALGSAYRTLLVECCREVTWDAGQDWNAMIELGEPGIEEGLLGAARLAAQEFQLARKGAVA